MAKNDGWNWIPMAPMSGMLDTRSKPAEMSPATFRYKLNTAVNRTGSLCVRPGYQALNFGERSDDPAAVANWDFHRRDASTRDPVTFLFESVAVDGARRLFAGTKDELRVLDNATSEWTKLSDGWGTAVWKAAELQDKIIFANNVNVPGGFGVKYHTVGGSNFNDVLSSGTINRARVAIAFGRCVFLMNLYKGGTDARNMVLWSDFEVGNDFRNSADNPGTISDYILLDSGDEILNAVEMLGQLYIFTQRSIWRCSVSPSTSSPLAFSFVKIYSEPENQTGCLVYPQSLVCTGRDLFWWSSDAIWTFNPYVVAPECPDWLLRGTGAVFSADNPDRLDTRCCESVVGRFHPDTREIRYSYPLGGSTVATCINQRELVLNTEYHTMDETDQGFTAYVNFRRTGDDPATSCNTGQVFIAASATDYCLKSLGGVFYREDLVLPSGGRTSEIPDAAYLTSHNGYFVRVVGFIPAGFPEREKTIREFWIDNEIAANDLAKPNLLTLRIGNSYNLVDPMALSSKCAPLWHDQDPLSLVCPDEATNEQMKSDGRRPSDPLSFTIYETGNRLYYDLRITSATGTAPTQHDFSVSAMRFDVAVTN